MPKGLRTLAFSFDAAHLTHFRGLVLLPRFCQQLRLRWLLQRDVLPPQVTGDFQPADLLLALIYVLIAGFKRVRKTQILQDNGAFLCQLGLERFPDPSSLRRFLRRLSPQTLRQLVRLHDRLRGALAEMPRARSTLLFDLDAVWGSRSTADSRARGWVTIPRRRDVARIIRSCVSRRTGRSSGTARCVRATPAPTRA